jgi:hypothetical protein
MGKHSGLKGAVPRQIGHEPEEGAESSWNDEVVKAMAGFEAIYTTKEELAGAYSYQRDAKEAKEKEAKLIAIRVEALERLLITRLEADGATSIGLASGEKFRLDDQPTAKVLDVDAFLAWIKANGMEHLLTVHANTRKAIATERYTAGLTETPGLELGLRTTIRRDKKK